MESDRMTAPTTDIYQNYSIYIQVGDLVTGLYTGHTIIYEIVEITPSIRVVLKNMSGGEDLEITSNPVKYFVDKIRNKKIINPAANKRVLCETLIKYDLNEDDEFMWVDWRQKFRMTFTSINFVEPLYSMDSNRALMLTHYLQHLKKGTLINYTKQTKERLDIWKNIESST